MKHRTWRNPVPNTIDPVPLSYIGYQKIINSNNDEVDEEKLQEHVEMIIEKGWEEIPVSFELLNKGDQIRYTTITSKKEHLFRTGGWVCFIDEENDPPIWLSYHAHTHSNWVLQLEDCQRLFVFRRPKKKAVKKDHSDTRVVFSIPGPETKYNVYLTDGNGVLQRVYSARDNYAKKRFMNSEKFKKAEQDGWKFKDPEI